MSLKSTKNVEKIEAKKRFMQQEEIALKAKALELKEEKELSRQLSIDLKRFLREDQAELRKEQAEKQRKFLEQIKLEKKIEQFRRREALEIKNLEKYVLSQQRESYEEVQSRIDRIKEKYKIVGAFQTRNIPHFGHEKIIERMLELCDHVVINPVIGPKKSGDVKLEVLEMVYEYLISHKYEHQISFLPIFANMFYAGPNEAIHHAILRQKVGFDLFSVGRDHAGAQAAYLPSLAVEKLVENEKNLNIKIFGHHGAVFCDTCNSAILFGECDHNVKKYKDIAGTQFRLSIKNKEIFSFADKDMQSYLESRNLEVFEE